MPNVNFYLKKKNANTGKSLVFLQMKYHGKTLRYSTKQTIEPTTWNSRKQRMKTNFSLTSDGQHLINDLLDNLEAILKKAYNSEVANGIPSTAYLKEKLDRFLNFKLIEEERKMNEPTLWGLIGRFERNEINYRGRQKALKTVQGYTTIRKQLQAFEKEEKYPVTFGSINIDFFHRFTAFLRNKKGLAHNTVSKSITQLKVFMNHANEMGMTTNMQHKLRSFSMPEQQTDAVYLNESELTKLYHLDLSENKRLERSRDLFLVGAFSGLRFADFNNIKKENIVSMDGELYLKILTKKTGELVVIPISPIIIDIMRRYADSPNSLPARISNQKFNKYIKEVCEAAGLTQTGRLGTDLTTRLCDAVSSHTCRRSFCTNLYLAGVDSRTIMACSGHRDTRSFEKYIKVSRTESAKMLQGHMKETASRLFLKAV